MLGLITQLADLIFPPRCVSCGRLGAFLCPRCQRKVKRAEPVCPVCHLASAGGATCVACADVSSLSGLICTADYTVGPTKALIHAYKYEKLSALAPLLGSRIARMIRKEKIDVDLIAFIPITAKRAHWRGFNQAELLAREVSKSIKRPLLYCLTKTKETKTQVGLGQGDRSQNIRGTFSYAGPNGAVEGKKVLLIDDVYTTGATCEEAARVLVGAGAASVMAATIARE